MNAAAPGPVPARLRQAGFMRGKPFQALRAVLAVEVQHEKPRRLARGNADHGGIAETAADCLRVFGRVSEPVLRHGPLLAVARKDGQAHLCRQPFGGCCKRHKQISHRAFAAASGASLLMFQRYMRPLGRLVLRSLILGLDT